MCPPPSKGRPNISKNAKIRTADRALIPAEMVNIRSVIFSGSVAIIVAFLYDRRLKLVLFNRNEPISGGNFLSLRCKEKVD